MSVTHLDELRTWPTERLRAARDEARGEERRWRLRRVDLDRVLDERGAAGPDAAQWVQTRDNVRTTTAIAEVEIGRALESLPSIRAAAEAGDLSFDQLAPLVHLATPETDAEWARRGTTAAPSDLARMVRRQRIVTKGEADERQHARELRWWRSRDSGMLNLRGAIPDVNGAFVEEVLEHMVNAMRPPRGKPWDTRAHRGADALVDLCRDYGTRSATKASWRPRVVVQMGSDAQPEVNGIPIALETVETLIDEGAPVREVHNGDPLTPARGDEIPAALRDYLKARDTQCRRPGCERTFGLDAHHLVPRSQGGGTDKHNVVLVCRPDHRLLPPHGPFVLDGNAEEPDGLAWHHRDEPGNGAADSRAGP